MALIYLVEGPVGVGKSTFAARLGANLGAPFLNLDDWMVTLFRADRPASGVMHWYAQRKHRCLEQIWKTACEIINSGSDVVLELGLIRRADRRWIFDLAEQNGYRLNLYVLDAPREIRRQRVQVRNMDRGGTFSMEVPAHIFEMASDLWEPVDQTECGDIEINYVDTGS